MKFSRVVFELCERTDKETDIVIRIQNFVKNITTHLFYGNGVQTKSISTEDPIRVLEREIGREAVSH